MKIVVTGALGHIGSALIRELPLQLPDAEIVMVDDLSAQRYCSLFHLPTIGNYRFVEADIFDCDLKSIIDGAEAVIHLAAITNAAGSFENKDLVEKINFDGTVRIAVLCEMLGVPLIFPSSTSVYGSQESEVDESCSLDDLKPQSPYADSKLKSELYLADRSQMGLRHVTLRLGTIFGTSPGMRFHTAVNKFCFQAVLGQPVTVWQTALHQMRPYLALEDAIGAILHILRLNRYEGEILNVVTLNATVDDILNSIRTEVGDLAVEFVDSPIMNQLSYHVLSERIAALGFEARGDLQRGISETIGWLRQCNVAGRERVPLGSK